MACPSPRLLSLVPSLLFLGAHCFQPLRTHHIIRNLHTKHYTIRTIVLNKRSLYVIAFKVVCHCWANRPGTAQRRETCWCSGVCSWVCETAAVGGRAVHTWVCPSCSYLTSDGIHDIDIPPQPPAGPQVCRSTMSGSLKIALTCGTACTRSRSLTCCAHVRPPLSH